MNARHKIACLLVSSGMMLAAGTIKAAVLGPGQSLGVGQPLPSADGAFFAMLTPDGNFAVYRSADHTVAWSTKTGGRRVVVATMQREGRLVLLDAAKKVIWATPTRGRHRVFGVTSWGTAMVVDARRWKPRPKRAEPFVDKMLRQRGRIHWQSKSYGELGRWRELNSH
ncbi:hypothetical protein FIV34_12390 [Luteibacter pinisoli]|uniref:Bulb-type lectin domain-containing protein n=1 Tax=Luteibacter pinisoli TaxID=2589080 RepID=A0A4Y5Z6D8_9GAMM|nr:hypothetical protein [Luteibacter pinisoli]QDE39955.1 hypothetical protein FIV34_12390 [Luteibacter pinisoli]